MDEARINAVAESGRLGRHVANYLPLRLYEKGLVVVRPGGRLDAFRWDSVEVRQDGHHYELTGPDGAKAVLREGIDHPEVWGPAILLGVTDAQSPAVIVAINEGRAVSFGELTVTLDALVTESRSVPWSHIQGVEVRDGAVMFQAEGKWRPLTATPAGEIPNLFVFCTLARRLSVAAARPMMWARAG